MPRKKIKMPKGNRGKPASNIRSNKGGQLRGQDRKQRVHYLNDIRKQGRQTPSPNAAPQAQAQAQERDQINPRRIAQQWQQFRQQEPRQRFMAGAQAAEDLPQQQYGNLMQAAQRRMDTELADNPEYAAHQEAMQGFRDSDLGQAVMDQRLGGRMGAGLLATGNYLTPEAIMGAQQNMLGNIETLRPQYETAMEDDVISPEERESLMGAARPLMEEQGEYIRGQAQPLGDLDVPPEQLQRWRQLILQAAKRRLGNPTAQP